jgi:sorbitol-specific phosphotransferase system component IIC
MVVWTELIDLHHAIEGERDPTDRHRKLDYRRLPCLQIMMISSPVALLVGRTDAIASTRL